jgi:hypothetical protein
MAALAIRYHYQTNEGNFKEDYPPDDRDRVSDRCVILLPNCQPMGLEMTAHNNSSGHWDCVLCTSSFAGPLLLLPNPDGYNRKGLRQLNARPI